MGFTNFQSVHNYYHRLNECVWREMQFFDMKMTLWRFVRFAVIKLSVSVCECERENRHRFRACEKFSLKLQLICINIHRFCGFECCFDGKIFTYYYNCFSRSVSFYGMLRHSVNLCVGL